MARTGWRRRASRWRRRRRSGCSRRAATRSTRRSPPTPCSASSNRCRAASAATCSRSSGTRRRKKLYGLNASGRSPDAATLELFRSKGLDGDPGPRAAELVGPRLRRRLGPAPPESSARGRWAELLAPAIHYAEDGFPVSEIIAADWQGAEARAREDPHLGGLLPARRARPRLGTVFRNPHLARSLRAIAEGGRDAFYRGPIAAGDRRLLALGGRAVRARDFADHTSTWVDPVSTNYRGYDVWELPPNGQGIAALQMLNLLEPYDLKKMGPARPRYFT